MPRTSAGERSSSADRSLLGSTVDGPPFLYTPVYVDCAQQSTGVRHHPYDGSIAFRAHDDHKEEWLL